MSKHKPEQLSSDAVSSDLSENTFASFLAMEASRQRMLSVVGDFVGSNVFRENVRRTVLEILGHDDAKSIISPTAKAAARDYIETESWKRKTFWIPSVISAVAAIAAIIAAVFAVKN